MEKPSLDHLPETLTVAEVAAFLKCGYQKALGLLHSGQIRWYPLDKSGKGGDYRVSKSALVEFLESRQTKQEELRSTVPVKKAPGKPHRLKLRLPHPA